jgi:hypothetical protein
MKITRPVAGGTASRISNLATDSVLTIKVRFEARPASFRLRLLSSRQENPAGQFSPGHHHNPCSGSNLPLKCRRNPPIPRGRKTATGGRKLPEGTTGGCLLQIPPNGKDAV